MVRRSTLGSRIGRRVATILITIMTVVALPGPATPAPIAAADDGGSTSLFGYFATIPATIRYNSAGGINTSARTAPGTFLVRFPRLAAAGGTVLVTPYASTSRPAVELFCQPQYWMPSGADEIVSVYCADRFGPADDAQFGVVFSRPVRGATGTYAYLWNNQLGSGTSVPHWTYQFNSSGGTNTVTRIGTGVWDVTLPNLGAWDPGAGGHIEVNSYGYLPVRCGVGGWGSDSLGGVLARVTCTSLAGAPVDSLFTLVFSNGVSLFGHNRFVSPPPYGGLGAAYLWAYQPSTPGTYTPFGYSWNGNGSANTVTRYGIGQYEAHFPNIIVLGGISAVTAYGDPTRHCSIAHSESGFTLINCYAASGALADSQFDVSYLNAGQT